MNEVFETERLYLRKIELSDAEDIFEFWSDPEVLKHTGSNLDTELEQAKTRIVNYFIPERLTLWALVDKLSGKMIGFIEIHPKGDQAELGWMMNRKFWGQGLMAEAVSKIRDFAFDKLEIQVLTADCTVDNPASSRVMEKVGMRKLGQIYVQLHGQATLSDYYAMTRKSI